MMNIDDCPHTLDLGRLRVLDNAQQKARGEVQGLYKNSQTLEKKRQELQVEIEAARKVLDQRVGYSVVTAGSQPSGLTQQSKDTWTAKLDTLNKKMAELKRTISENSAAETAAQERFNAASQLYATCKDYAGARYEH